MSLQAWAADLLVCVGCSRKVSFCRHGCVQEMMKPTCLPLQKPRPFCRAWEDPGQNTMKWNCVGHDFRGCCFLLSDFHRCISLIGGDLTIRIYTREISYEWNLRAHDNEFILVFPWGKYLQISVRRKYPHFNLFK